MLQKLFFVMFLVFNLTTTSASESKRPDENFMFVLREMIGANKPEFGFSAVGKVAVPLQNGESVDREFAWYNLIGDMHVRFVVDGKDTMQNLTSKEFLEFGLTPNEAVTIAIANIENKYGTPQATIYESGVGLIEGGSPDLVSSYFLDKTFWNELLKKYPEGLVVGVPKRGGMIFVPISNGSAVAWLEDNIHSLFETSEDMRVSAALYLFESGSWRVYRDPPQ